MTAAIVSLSGCNQSKSNDEIIADYDKVVDVPISGWSHKDTLYFPLELTWPAYVRAPLLKGVPYKLGCCIRFSSDYPLSNVPMLLIVQQTDTTGNNGREQVIRNLLRRDIAPQLRDDKGRNLGNGWGSLISQESMIDSLTLKFDSIGNYRILLTPKTGQLTEFKGIASIGLQLLRNY